MDVRVIVITVAGCGMKFPILKGEGEESGKGRGGEYREGKPDLFQF